MTDEAEQLIPMRIAELRRTQAAEPGLERHILFLADDQGRRLPIWIGAAMALVLDQVQLSRPGVYQSAASLPAGAGGQLREVRVTELTESTFYAQAILADDTSVDARPSDALTLALVTEAPIYVAGVVLERAQERRHGQARGEHGSTRQATGLKAASPETSGLSPTGSGRGAAVLAVGQAEAEALIAGPIKLDATGRS